MNSKKTIISVTIISLIIYNVVMFLMPFTRNINFWVVYVSTMTAIIFAGGVFVTKLTRKGVENKVKNSPLAWVGWEYLIIQILVSAYELMYPMYYKTSLIINIALLGINVIFLSIVGTEKKEIDRVDNKVKEKVFSLKILQENIETIKSLCQDEQINNKLTELTETVRFSDPMSSNKLFEIENDIEIKVSQLKEKIELNNIEEAEELIAKIKTLLAERNRKAKMYKGMPDDEKEEKPVKGRTVTIAGVSFIVLIVIGIASYYSIILPNHQYNEAMNLLDSNKYLQAKYAFDKLSGYKDSDDKAKEAVYRYAMELIDNDMYEEAVKLLETIKDYNNSNYKIKETIYKYATKLFENKEYEKAEIEFNKILDYSDSKSKLNEVIYEYASELLKNKEYSKAATEFLKLDNYKDSKEKVTGIYNLLGEKDVIYFGKYNGKPIGWQTIETSGRKVLLIATETIDEMAYNTDYKAVAWADSSIRKWLNNEFYNSFDESEKGRIVRDTINQDMVFLLSDSEVKKHTNIKNTSKSWWLRERGEDETKAMYVTENGKINSKGDIATRLHGVRPSIWLDLDK